MVPGQFGGGWWYVDIKVDGKESGFIFLAIHGQETKDTDFYLSSAISFSLLLGAGS